MKEKMTGIEKRLKEIGKRDIAILEGTKLEQDWKWMYDTIQDQIKMMQDLSKEFDSRFANHKLIRSDLEAKLDHARNEVREAENDRRYMRDKLIKQQELLDYYAEKKTDDEGHPPIGT